MKVTSYETRAVRVPRENVIGLEGRGQVWMTGTEPGLFAPIGGDATRLIVRDGAVHPA